MGFLDVIRGKRQIKKAAPTDRVFAMTTAQITLEMQLGLKSTGKAAICFQPLATADFEQIVRDMEEVVRSSGSDTGTTIDVSDDDFGYRWMVLSDPDFEDLVVGINAVSTALEGGGYGDRILAAVFPFRDEAGKRRPLDLQLQARQLLPVRPGGRRAAARQRARAAPEGPDRRRAADRARARALVPPLGHPGLTRAHIGSAAPELERNPQIPDIRPWGFNPSCGRSIPPPSPLPRPSTSAATPR